MDFDLPPIGKPQHMEALPGFYSFLAVVARRSASPKSLYLGSRNGVPVDPLAESEARAA